MFKDTDIILFSLVFRHIFTDEITVSFSTPRFFLLQLNAVCAGVKKGPWTKTKEAIDTSESRASERDTESRNQNEFDDNVVVQILILAETKP